MLISPINFSKKMFWILLLALLILGIPIHTNAQENGLNLHMVQVQNDPFPNVTLTVRALDTNGNALDTLSAEDIDVYEVSSEGTTKIENFEILDADPLPKHVIFVIDLGQFSNYGAYDRSELQESLTTFAQNGHFRDGIDSASVYLRVNNGTDKTQRLLENSKSVELFESTIENVGFTSSNNQTAALDGVEDARRDIEALGSEPFQQNSAIVFLSNYIQLPATSQQIPRARDIALDAREGGIQIYTIQARRESNFSEPLEALSELSGGLSVKLSSSQTNSDQIRALYEQLDQQSQAFQIRYQTANFTSGAREYRIVPKGADPANATAIGTLELELNEPRVEVTSFESTINRVPEGGSLNNDTTAIQGQIQAWPHDFTLSSLEAAELLIDGQIQATIPNPAPTGFVFELPLDNIKEDRDIAFQVRVRDAAGIIALSQVATIAVRVDTIVLDACAENEDGETCQATRMAATAVAVEATRLSAEATRIAIEGEEEVGRANQRTVIVGTISAIIIVGLVVLLFVFRSQIQQAGQVLIEGGGLDKAVKTLLGGVSGSQNVLARLLVLDGPHQGESVEIYTMITTLGRDPESADILFYEGEDSSVSRGHCTITIDGEDRSITDDNSTHGTFVAEHRLKPNSPYPLNDGDIIVLGNLFRRGIRLQFLIHTDDEPVYADSYDDAEGAYGGYDPYEEEEEEYDTDSQYGTTQLDDPYSETTLYSDQPNPTELDRPSWEDRPQPPEKRPPSQPKPPRRKPQNPPSSERSDTSDGWMDELE